ncbi:MAG: AI-2E family transporter [Micromonosporaceae bacterium]
MSTEGPSTTGPAGTGEAATGPVPGPRPFAASDDRAGAATSPETRSEGRFGRPGPPLARSPFLVGFTAGLGLLLAYAVFLALRNAVSIFVLIFIAMFIAVGLNPIVVRLQRWGLPRWLAVTTVALGIVVMFAGVLLALIPPLVTQASNLVDNAPEYFEQLRRNQMLRNLDEQYDLFGRLQGALADVNLARVAGGVLGGAQAVFGAVFNVLTVLVLTVYFMAAFDRIKAGAYRLVPASRRVRVQAIGDEILTKVGAYMAGALTIAIIAGASAWVFLVIVGVAYPFALAVVVAVCDLIPQVGATIGAVVVSVVGFIHSIPVGIACVVFFVAYQQIENFLIYPKVMRRAVKVSDLAAIIGALLGFTLLGIVGALIAIPAVAAIQLIVREVVIPRQQRA